MLPHEIVEKYNAMTESMARDKDILHEYFKNADVPYEERRDVWEKTPRCLQTIEPWVFHPKGYEAEYGEVEWYDDFYLQRSGLFYLDLDTFWHVGDEEEAAKQYAIMQRDFVNAGIHGFVYDW